MRLTKVSERNSYGGKLTRVVMQTCDEYLDGTTLCTLICKSFFHILLKWLRFFSGFSACFFCSRVKLGQSSRVAASICFWLAAAEVVNECPAPQQQSEQQGDNKQRVSLIPDMQRILVILSLQTSTQARKSHQVTASRSVERAVGLKELL